MASANTGKLNKSQADAWKKHAKSKRPAPLELPSGLTAMVRAPGMEAFLAEGKIPNSLVPIIKEQLEAARHRDQDKPAKRERSQSEIMDEVLGDPEKLQDIVRMADSITCSVVSDPPIHPNPNLDEGEERDPELIYADDLSMDDKMFIMNYAMGGPKTTEPFREAATTMLEPVPARKPTSRTTKRASGAAKKSR